MIIQIKLYKYKDIIDEVIDNNGWLVLMTYWRNKCEKINSLMYWNYVVSNNIEIVTPQEV